MASFDFKRMRIQGSLSLENASYPPKKVIMIHSGVTIGVGLLLSVISYLLDMGIAQTGGLGGIGARTILETGQTLLETANMLLLPFWAIGYIRAVLCWTREEPVEASTLMYGFRCFRPVMRLLFLQMILYVILGLIGMYAGAAVFLLTPGAQSFYALMQEVANSGVTDPYAIMENEAYLSASLAMAPYMMGGAALLIAPMAFRMRFAEYAMMDKPEQGALRALLQSWRMTRKNCLALLKLDLCFWWFYLAQILIIALGNGEMLLGMAGISLDISGDAAMFAFYIAGLLCEFALYVWKKNEVFAVYALAYEQLCEPCEMPEKPQPKNVPWSY